MDWGEGGWWTECAVGAGALASGLLLPFLALCLQMATEHFRVCFLIAKYSWITTVCEGTGRSRNSLTVPEGAQKCYFYSLYLHKDFLTYLITAEHPNISLLWLLTVLAVSSLECNTSEYNSSFPIISHLQINPWWLALSHNSPGHITQHWGV